MGLSRPRLDAAEVPVRADGSWVGERGTEAQVEVAADPAEQRGLSQRLHISLAYLCYSHDCIRAVHREVTRQVEAFHMPCMPDKSACITFDI